MSFANRTITVYASGLETADEEIRVAKKSTVTWLKEVSVASFNVHFDESPFDEQFGPQDYPDGAGPLTALAQRDDDPDYIRYHKYTLTVHRADGSSQEFDPHVIVVAT